MSINDKKPCLVQTGQGFSVKYNERLLYSKYNPAKNILLSVQDKQILPGTLILAISPCLGYGIKELLEKLTPDCFVLGIEKDPGLMEFTLHQEAIKESLNDSRFMMMESSRIAELPLRVNQDSLSTEKHAEFFFKRCIRIDFSGGASLNADFYRDLFECTSSAIAQFWKNRITLVKFGKRYSKNLFKNLCFYSQSNDICRLYKTQTKDILVLGAGEGLDPILFSFKNKTINPNNFFIIAVDAAIPALSKNNIKADLLVLEESQWIIKSLFIGNSIKAKDAAVSLSSSPAAVKNSTENVFFYTTLFSNAKFIKKLLDKKLSASPLPPLGSVGLTAVDLAIKIRSSNEINIFVAGLDFSYSIGKTHSSYAKQSETLFLRSNRLERKQNCQSAFGYGCSKTISKSNTFVYTSTNLSGYAQLFRNFFFNIQNLFDCSTTGLPLNLPYKPLTESKKFDLLPGANTEPPSQSNKNNPEDFEKNKKAFFKSELEDLTKIQEILTTGQNMDETERNTKLQKLLADKDYLYQHFPDGYKLRIEADFLKRVKAEIVCFKKLFIQLTKN